MTVSTNQQVKSLIWRYWLCSKRWPISTAIRVIIRPVGLIAFFLVIISLIKNSMEKDGSPIKGAIVALFPSLFMSIIASLQVYHYSRWIIKDRETGMKSLMLSMGVRRSSFYLADSICFLVPLLPVIITFAIMMIMNVFSDSYSSSLSILTLFILFSIHLTGLMFALSSLFTSVKYQFLVIVILLYEPAIHYLVVWVADQSSASFLPTIVFISSLSPFESIRLLFDSYALCKNCDETLISAKTYQISQPTHLIMIAMLFWTLVAFAFARWFDEVCPWQGDSAVKGMFFCCSPNQDSLDEVNSIELGGGSSSFDTSIERSKYFENVARVNRKVGIRIRKLSKQYNRKAAVNDVSLDIYAGEATLLLGHNGAGKTTLMDIILGKLSCDSGQVVVNNSSLLSDEASIGVCPQASILDENLSVRDHLEVFYNLKRTFTSQSERNQHIEETLKDVYLTENAGKLPDQLSGGMKRKLSLALAFVGGSNVLILDEPSSGLDPESRVSIWKTIRRQRVEKTVLLSTQHMEEADYLGDRVAIMSEGKLICCGSSIFLNNLFGSGYRLRLECKSSERTNIIELVRKHFAQASSPEEKSSMLATDDIYRDLVIELNPDVSQDYDAKLINLLEELEKLIKADDSFITSLGLKSSSMDDILSKTKTKYEETREKDSTRVTIKPSSENMVTFSRLNSTQNQDISDSEQLKLFFKALLIKNFQVWGNDLFAFVFRAALAIIGCYYVLRYLQNTMSNIMIFGDNFLGVAMVNYLVYYPTIEHASKLKVLQLSSRVNFIIYWLAFLVGDLLLVTLLVVEINIVFATLFEGVLIEPGWIIHLMISFAVLLFGISSALLAYIFSTTLKNIEQSLAYFSLYFLINPIISIIVSIISMIMSKDLRYISEWFNYLFALMVPLEAMQRVILGLGTQCYVESVDSTGCKPAEGFISPILYGFACSILQIISFAIALYYIEIKRFDIIAWIRLKFQFRSKVQLKSGKTEHSGDDDVREERKKVATLISTPHTARVSHSLLAMDLCKSFTKGVKAVDNLSFGIGRGECFGLLGVNGAGKTTTFAMVAQELWQDSGRIWMGEDESLGYDPQSNPDMLLTVEQALYLMARLRMVPERHIAPLVSSMVELLELTEHLNKVAKTLSGGSKRKLFLAMSLIGNTSFLALDEPTAGVDPMARRNVWLLLKSMSLHNQTSIMVSSHVMEECEAICDRLAMMARGKLRCLGTLLHLRSKFSQSCTIKIQLADQANGNDFDKVETVSHIKSHLEKELNNISLELIDTNFNSATFKVSDSTLLKSSLFRELVKLRQAHPQLRYQVNDSSFEDIFLAIAREQHELDELVH